MNLMTIMYIAIQETLNDPEDTALSYKALCELRTIQIQRKKRVYLELCILVTDELG